MPQRPWQEECTRLLRHLLAGYHPRDVHSQLRVTYFCFPNRELGDAQVVQVWYGNWALHVQCAWHGHEERSRKYRLSPSDILVSLDVEKSKYAQFDISVIEEAQRAVLPRMQTMANAQLDGIADLRAATGRGHHLVWQPMPFCPDAPQSILCVAERITTLTRILYGEAWAALQSWACAKTMELEMAD
jgi:hypothetical protein